MVDVQDDYEGQVCWEEEANVLVGRPAATDTQSTDDLWSVDGPSRADVEDVVPLPGSRHLQRPVQ